MRKGTAFIVASIAITPLPSRPGIQNLWLEREPACQGRAASQSQQLDFGQLTVDQLIDSLPPIECEWRRDVVSRKLNIDPAVVELRARLNRGDSLSATQWRRALEKCGAIRIRSRWPSSVPLAVEIQCPVWLGLAEIRMTPVDPSLASASAGGLRPYPSGATMYAPDAAQRCHEIGMLRSGENTLVFNVEVERGLTWEQVGEHVAGAGPILWSGKMEFTVTSCESVKEVLPAVEGGSWDEGVRDAISVAVLDASDRGSTKKPALVIVDPDTSKYPGLQHVALSLSVQLLHEDSVVEQHDLLAARKYPFTDPSSFNPGAGGSFAATEFTKLPPDAWADGDASGEWTLLVHGIGKGTLYQLWADRAFVGSLEIPVQEAIDRERRRVGAGTRRR